MKITSQVLLNTTREQADALKRTMRLTNACCDYMSQWAFTNRTFRRFALQKAIYREVRDSFPTLSSQMIIRAFAKVSDAYAVGKNIQRTFKPLGAISYDDRVLGFNLDCKCVSIWSVDGRLKIPFQCGDRQLSLLMGKRGESNLCLIKGRLYLFVSCDVDTPLPSDVQDVLGVDLGIVSIAVDSDGEVYSGKDVEDNRRKIGHRRRNLQRNGSRSAKRKLKKISGKQSRFQKNTNHVISKRIVQKAQDTKRAIGLEDLTGIRGRVTVRSRQRARHANWSFLDLRSKIEYKAILAGVQVRIVDPRNTSKMCSACGHIDKSNRKTQSRFVCVKCGFVDHADHNAAANIAARAVVMPPMVSANP